MKEIVLILDAATINLAAGVCANLPECQVYVFDPVLVDKLPIGQFGNVELITAFSGPEHQMLHRNSLAEAAEIEAGFDEARIASGCEIPILGWRFLSYYYFSKTARWYSALAEWLGERFSGRRVHFFTGDHPAEFYFDSFLAPTILISHLSRHGVECISHGYTNSRTVTYPVLDLSASAASGISGCDLVHLPTCFYDHEYFSAELRAAGRHLIHLESPYWDVPVEAECKVGLADPDAVMTSFEHRERSAVDNFTASMRSVGDRIMTPFFDFSDFRATQAQHLAQRYRSQLITYIALQRHFEKGSLARLVISNHDTGIHGPLIAFAEQRGLQVVMLPHSKVSMDIEFRCTNLVVFTHPIQGHPIHGPRGQIIHHTAVRYPEVFRGSSEKSRPLRVVSLVLNDTSLSGIPFAPAEAYLSGIGQMVAWAERNQLFLKVRVRPGATIIRLLTKMFGMDPAQLTRQVEEPMEDHAKNCDICLMYEMPTSGSLYFFRNSIPVLNPTISNQVGAPFALLHPDLIRSESVCDTLTTLDRFMADPLLMHEYRFNQFAAYVRLFQNAKPLSSMLASRENDPLYRTTYPTANASAAR